MCQSQKVIISILFIAAAEVKEDSKVKKRPVGHGNTGGSNQDTKQADRRHGNMRPSDRKTTQGATRLPKKNRRLSHMRPSDSEQESDQTEPGDHEATQGTTQSPKNKRLSHMESSDSEEVGQAEPGDCEATQGTTRSPKNRRLSHMRPSDSEQEGDQTEPGDGEATQGAVESPKRRRLLNQRHVSHGDNLHEAGRSKRDRNKSKPTQKSGSSPRKKQRLSSRGSNVRSDSGDHEATQGATHLPKKNGRVSYMRCSDSELEGSQAEPGDREGTQGTTHSPKKKRRLSSKAEPGDREATQGKTHSPEKNPTLSQIKPSDSEQEASQAEPSDCKTTQGAKCSPKKNRRLSGPAEPGDREAIEGTIESPRKRRLSNLRNVSHGDDLHEAGRSKRGQNKSKPTQESESSPTKKQRLSSRGLDVHSESGDHEATQGAIRSPEKNRTQSHMKLSDSEQEASQAEPGDHKATQEATHLPQKNGRLSGQAEPGDREGTTRSPEKNRRQPGLAEPGDREATQGAKHSPKKNRRLYGLAEPGDREATEGTIDSPRKRTLSNLGYVSHGDDRQEAGRSKRSRTKRKFTQESESSPRKKQRLSSRGSDVYSEPGDRKATQEATRSPEKNQTLYQMKLSDSEQEAGQVEPSDCKTTQGAMHSPKKNRRLSGLAEPGDRETIEVTIQSPRKRRLSNLRYVSNGDDRQEAGRSKRSRTKGKFTQESESSSGKKQRLSSTRPDVHVDSSEGDPFRKALKNLLQINRTDTRVNKETSSQGQCKMIPSHCGSIILLTHFTA